MVFHYLLDAMGRDDLKSDPRFSSAEKRVENRDAIDNIVADWMRMLPTDEARRRLEENKMVAGSVFEVDQIFDDAHYRARNAIAEIMDRDLGELKMPAPVPKMSLTPGRVKWTGKDMGADNDFVFKELLGFGDEAIAKLSQAGVI